MGAVFINPGLQKLSRRGVTGIGTTVPIFSLQKHHKIFIIFLSWEIYNQHPQNRQIWRFFYLRKQYENLRRPFRVTKEVPYTNVWTYPPVPYYPGKHPCEKPIEMMIDIISASTRPGDVVADFFMGSGSTIKAALQLGRQAIGVELEEERFLQTVSEIESL